MRKYNFLVSFLFSVLLTALVVILCFALNPFKPQTVLAGSASAAQLTNSAADPAEEYYFEDWSPGMGYLNSLLSFTNSASAFSFYLNANVYDIVSIDWHIDALGSFGYSFQNFGSGLSGNRLTPHYYVTDFTSSSFHFEIPQSYIDNSQNYFGHIYFTPHYYGLSSNVSIYNFEMTFNLSDGSSLALSLVSNPIAWDGVLDFRDKVFTDAYQQGYESGYNTGYQLGLRDGFLSAAANYSFSEQVAFDTNGLSEGDVYLSVGGINLLLNPGTYSLIIECPELPISSDLVFRDISGIPFFTAELWYGESTRVTFEFTLNHAVIFNSWELVQWGESDTDWSMHLSIKLFWDTFLYNMGYESGFIDGEVSGYDQGWTNGKNFGYQEGFREGFDAGNEVGFRNGFNEGLTVSIADVNGVEAVASIANGVFNMLSVKIFGFFSFADFLYIGVTFAVFRFAMKSMN